MAVPPPALFSWPAPARSKRSGVSPAEQEAKMPQLFGRPHCFSGPAPPAKEPTPALPECLPAAVQPPAERKVPLHPMQAAGSAADPYPALPAPPARQGRERRSAEPIRQPPSHWRNLPFWIPCCRICPRAFFPHPVSRSPASAPLYGKLLAGLY